MIGISRGNPLPSPICTNYSVKIAVVINNGGQLCGGANQEVGPPNGSKIGIYTPKVLGEDCRGAKQHVGVVVNVTTG